MGEFTENLEASPLRDGKNWLVARLGYVTTDRAEVVVPAGFVTDFASIPPLPTYSAAAVAASRLLLEYGGAWVPGWLHWPLVCVFWLGVVAALASYPLLCDSRIDGPATLHDYVYRVLRGRFAYSLRLPRLGLDLRWSVTVTGKLAGDLLLLEALQANKVPRWKAVTIFLAVALCGWPSYWGDARRQKKI